MKKKIFVIKCISLISLVSIYKLLEYILKLNNLAFMNRIIYLFTSIFTILIFLILVQLITVLYTIAREKIRKASIRLVSGIGATLVAFSIVFLMIFGFLAFAFLHQPEHIVEKDGKPMVAYVNSFMEVDVYYYDYVNSFVRGNIIKIGENYGNGGYDPFKKDEMPKVKRYIYYDDNGKAIKSNW